MTILASTKIRFLTALGVLALSAAWAATTVRTLPQYQGPDTRLILEIKESLPTAPVAAPLSRDLVATPRTVASGVLSNSGGSQPAKVQVSTAETPSAPPAKPAGGSAAPAPAPAPATESPVKNIALMGVTSQGGTEEAWLIDLASNERETVSEGEDAFGFKVREIEAESIRLARGDEEFEIHLGEKHIPVPEPEAPATDPASNNPGFRNGGNGGGRWAARAAAFAAGGGFNRGGFGGGRSWNGGGGGNNGFNRGSFGGGNFNRGGQRFASSYQVPVSYGGGFNSGGRSQTRTQAAGPTSNPQTARRRGGQLVGGADPLPTPKALSNPQTTRRLGTNSGPAFGTGNNNSRSGNSSSNRNGNSSRSR